MGNAYIDSETQGRVRCLTYKILVINVACKKASLKVKFFLFSQHISFTCPKATS